MKVALVHDYLNSYGGAEVVLAALHEIWPEAPIYTIFSILRKERLGVWGRLEKLGESRREKDQLLKEKFQGAKIIESWFGKIPFCEKLISPLRFLIPLIWKSFAFSQFDLVISSASWAVTKGFGEERKDKGEQKDKRLIEVCYCHTPPRYLYGYETSRDWQKHWWIRVYATVVNHFMRMYDFSRAQKVTVFIANSREVQARIKKFYQREAKIINPPVEIGGVGEVRDVREKKYFLTGGRLEMAKNFDLIVRAFNQLELPLKIYGSGSQEKSLREMAGPTVEFLGKVREKEKWRLMAGCQAFIAAATDEDFGITPVEAMAAGRPVIAYRGGGYLETVVEGKTGVFFPPSPGASEGHGNEPTVESLVSKLQSFRVSEYKSEDCWKQAEKFSKERFKEEIRKLAEEILKDEKN